MKRMIHLQGNALARRVGSSSFVSQNWLLITVSTPSGGSSTLRVYAWRNLRRLGAHYLQQSVCVLPATPKTARATARVVTRLRAEGGHGEVLRITLTDARQESAIISAIQREREDEYRELIGSTAKFRAEIANERHLGRTTYTELEESDVDLVRLQKWLAAIRARDYFDAPGGKEAAAAVASCEEALAGFESEALSAELDESASSARPNLRAVDEADG
jgi:ChrB-like protein